MFQGMEQRIFRLARAGGIDTNPTTFTQRAGTFASAATNTGQATLLTRRESSGLNGYLILPAAALGTNAPLHLAHTVGARAEEVQMPEDLGDTPAIGTLNYKPSPALRETQSDIDPTELPRILANAMPEGSWVAVTMRKPSNKERKFYTPWLGNRLGTAVPTHHSTSPTAVVVSITAGGSSKEEVTSLLSQVTAGLPGFDLDSGVRFAPTKRGLLFGLPIGLLLAAATLFGLPQLPAEYAAFIPASIAPILYAISGVAVILGLAALAGRISSPDTKLRNQLAQPVFAPPSARRGRPRPPRKEQTVRGSRTINGERVPFEKFIPASDGDYPLAPDTFMVGPTVVVGMVSPHAGAVSGAATTRARSTPPVMLQKIGPLLGMNDDGSAHLSAAAMLFGVAIVGKPGSGKSLCARSLFGWHRLERVNPSGKPATPEPTTQVQVPTNRVPKGVRAGGQFTASARTEPAVSITEQDFASVGDADVDQLRALAESNDPLVRAEVTASIRVPDDVLERLAEPDQPASVRLAAVNTGYAGTADRAANDPHPLVRAAATASWDLSEANRKRLEHDPKVQRVMGFISR